MSLDAYLACSIAGALESLSFEVSRLYIYIHKVILVFRSEFAGVTMNRCSSPISVLTYRPFLYLKLIANA